MADQTFAINHINSVLVEATSQAQRERDVAALAKLIDNVTTHTYLCELPNGVDADKVQSSWIITEHELQPTFQYKLNSCPKGVIVATNQKSPATLDSLKTAGNDGQYSFAVVVFDEFTDPLQVYQRVYVTPSQDSYDAIVNLYKRFPVFWHSIHGFFWDTKRPWLQDYTPYELQAVVDRLQTRICDKDETVDVFVPQADVDE